MKRAALFTAMLVALLAASQTGCGSKRSSSNQDKISPAQLAQMPVPKSGLGPDAAGLALSDGSGVQTNTDAARNASGNVSAARLARLGRISGYQLDYGDIAGIALGAGHGLLEVTTEVDLYRNAKAAETALAFWRKDEANVAQLKSTGLLVSGGLYNVDVSDGSFGFSGVMNVEGKSRLRGADITFRMGRLLAHASVSTAIDDNPRPLTLALARKLETRIEQVLDGKISGPPVPLPARTSAKPDLPAMALTIKDLGGGKITKQGYKTDSSLNALSEYNRTMVPGGSFPYLDDTVALFHNQTDARVTFYSLDKVFSSAKIMKASGSHFTTYEPRRVPIRAGEEARATIAKAQEASGPVLFESFVLVRIGSTLEIVVTTASSAPSSSALQKLATIVATRAQAGLARKP